ncbi:hypothetical protein LHFGNBLO_001436 [Mesorhizobium sp. AR10]|uniref:hypothetical protein n=1 Tax=Mesorhizobium sp. AR10 TaxID=2865839 RepID=UPI00215E1513|nr:hypothetical protein [Mesorhizobium sp. AR10]UVK40012.1 hypothetical protein LHFGNBLO_001436 [Mesorhizobium sp. AR10]
MKSAILALLPFASIALASPTTGDAGKALDLAGVTAVVITGEASSVRLTTSTTAPYHALIKSRREGWFASWYSSWFANDCLSASDMKREASTLHIDVAPSSWLDPSDCVVEITANIQPESSVSIDQAALRANMTGNFSAIAINGKAADVSLDGHASTVDLKGEALKVYLAFGSVRQDENIAITGKALDATLSFGRQVPISYSVTASASFVDSSIANTAGAKPSVIIKGDFVRATIR